MRVHRPVKGQWTAYHTLAREIFMQPFMLPSKRHRSLRMLSLFYYHTMVYVETCTILIIQAGRSGTRRVSGIPSVCSDAVAKVYLTGKPNFSLGCDGSRKFSGINDDEMVMGFPAEMLPEMVDAVKIITQAPGSKKT
jgi:hypothetical protein